MIKSEAINELATALAKAQGELKSALKDSSNPFFHSNYADLASVWDACRKPLSENGLSIIQTLDKTETGTMLETTLLHASGQFITSTLKITPKDETSQAIGSAITYARRYALSAMVGVCADEDDDGEAAMGRTKVKPAAQQPAKPAPAVSPTTKEVKTPPVPKESQIKVSKTLPTPDKIKPETIKEINDLAHSMIPDNKTIIQDTQKYMYDKFQKQHTNELTEEQGQQLLEVLKSGKIKEGK